jgi:hypothetical protein
LLFPLAGPAADTASRGIVPEEVVQARPKAMAPKAAASSVKYQLSGSSTAAAVSQRPTGGRQVGVTIWRLRAAVPGDSPVRILVQDEAGTMDWIPERVAAANRLKAGDRVRLTIESPETGYLYVIDRERYTSGERGQPYLIFPTTRTRNGDNRVSAGKLIDIPAQDDRPNFFRLSQSRPDQTEEELTVLLTPQPIEGLHIGPKAQPVTLAQYDEWDKKWGSGKVDLFELSGGAGKAWTKAEQQAAADATRVLTQDDPPPQTVYRVVTGNGKDPLLVKVRLRYQ